MAPKTGLTKPDRSNSLEGASDEFHATPPETIERLAAKATPRAHELLAQQPASLIGLTQAQRNAVVVTAVADDAGNEYALSRIGDDVWDLSPEMPAKNKSATEKKIRWPRDASPALLDDAKAAVYCALRQGRDDLHWSASSAGTVGNAGTVTLRHLTKLGLDSFGQVRSLYVSDHIAELRKSTGASTIYGLAPEERTP